MRLKRRPLKITQKEHIGPTNLERNFSHIDNQLIQLDDRRIAQQTEVSVGSDDAATIVNLTTAINNLIQALNASDLTDE